MEILRWEVFIPLVVGFPNLRDKLCFVCDVLSELLHGVVNPRAFLRILEDSVIEQGQLRAEILKGNISVNQMISPHLCFMLVLGKDVVGRSDFLMNRGSQLENTVRQQRGIPLGSFCAYRESVKLQLSSGFNELHSTFATHGFDN